MSTGPIHPLAGSVAATGLAAESASTDRARRLRQDRKVFRIDAHDPATQERQVETADAVEAINPESHGKQPPRKQPSHRHDESDPAADDDGPEHLDIQA
ncbi:MAG: hypothetical protein QM770_18370 [Tepidisphaeraceae bacterium]